MSKKKSKKFRKAAKSKLTKIEKKLMSATDALLTISIETEKGWAKLFKKSITVSKPIREKQIDMFFDTTDAVRNQIEEGAVRFKKALGINENIKGIIQKKINKNKIAKEIADNTNKLVAVINDGGLKDAVAQGVVKIKMEIARKFDTKGKKKKKSVKKKSTKKKETITKSKVTNIKKVKPKKTKDSALKKAITKVEIKPTSEKVSKKGSTTNTKKASTSTGAKRGPKPGAKNKTATTVAKKTGATSKAKKNIVAKRGRPAGSTNAKKTSISAGVKRGPKPGSKRKVTTAITKKSIAGKRGRKPNPTKPGFDDLKKVMGVGAKMEKILNRKGIKSYSDLHKVPVKNLQVIINSAGGYYQSYKPEMWKSEAALAAAGKFDEMKSGRR